MASHDIIVQGAKYAALVLCPVLILFFGYRIYAHPLSSHPGPLTTKLSDLYNGVSAVARRLHLTTYLDQHKYGPVMRHGPNKLVFNTAEAVRDIYNNDKVTKSHVYMLTAKYGKASVFSALDRTQHRQKRKLIGGAVSDKAFRSFEETMVEQVNIFVNQLMASYQESPTSPINMTERCERLGLDTATLYAFGYALNTQTSSEHRFLIRGLAIGTWQNNCFMQFPLFKLLGIHHLMAFVGYRQRMKYLRLLRTMIDTRIAAGKHTRDDFYSYVEHLEDPTEIWSEATFFLPAAGDTTNTALAGLFFYLSRNPEAYRKLAAEIRTTFNSSEEIVNGPKLTGCQYLRVCIDEALRMSPPVPGTLWRELYPEEKKTMAANKQTFTIDGQVVPYDTQVGVSAYCIHHNEKYFPEPFAFRPERWLEADKESLRRMYSAFIPFSVGPRGCAGKSFAYLEISLVFAKTLWLMDFKTAPGKAGLLGGGWPGRKDGRGRPDECQLWDRFGSDTAGPNLVFTPRE